jgi:hypothetical protein
MNRELWLQRYKAQLRKHSPGLTFSDWTEQDDRKRSIFPTVARF